MDYRSLVEKQIKPLLKFAFVFVGDIEEAKAILQKSIKKCTKIAHSKKDEKEATSVLTEEVIRQCYRYTKTFSYYKDKTLKMLGIKWYDSQITPWRAMNKLPKGMREVAIGHYILQLTHAEMAKTFHLPPGHVSSYLKKANEKLGILSDSSERDFIKQLQKDLVVIDELDWSTFIQITQPQHIPKKYSYMIWGGSALLMASIIITTVALKEKNENVESEKKKKKKDAGGGLANENDSNLDGADENPIIYTPIEPRVLEDISFKLAVYEGFYRYNFLSAKEAKKQAADRLYRYISTIGFANERNIYLNESEQIELERSNRDVVEYLKYSPTEEKYLNNVLDAFQITEEQYVEYLLTLENEYLAYENKMYELEVNQEPLVEKLYVEGTPAAYYERVGISVEEAKEIQKSWEQTEYIEVTERQFNLPFDLTGSDLHIIQLENGQYVFENPSYFGLYNTKYWPFIETHVFGQSLLSVNRLTLDDMIAHLENFDTDDAINKQLANELVEVYKLLKQSIEWELN